MAHRERGKCSIVETPNVAMVNDSMPACGKFVFQSNKCLMVRNVPFLIDTVKLGHFHAFVNPRLCFIKTHGRISEVRGVLKGLTLK